MKDLVNVTSAPRLRWGAPRWARAAPEPGSASLVPVTLLARRQSCRVHNMVTGLSIRRQMINRSFPCRDSQDFYFNQQNTDLEMGFHLMQ